MRLRERVLEEDGDDASSAAAADGSDAHYNPGETRGQFEMRIKPYEIPIETTTYVDFVFNLPDDIPDLVHVVFSEAIVSQPQHLQPGTPSGNLLNQP